MMKYIYQKALDQISFGAGIICTMRGATAELNSINARAEAAEAERDEARRKLAEARELERYVRDVNDYEIELTACPVCDYPPIICECSYTNIRAWLAAHPAPANDPH